MWGCIVVGCVDGVTECRSRALSIILPRALYVDRLRHVPFGTDSLLRFSLTPWKFNVKLDPRLSDSVRHASLTLTGCTFPVNFGGAAPESTALLHAEWRGGEPQGSAFASHAFPYG